MNAGIHPSRSTELLAYVQSCVPSCPLEPQLDRLGIDLDTMAFNKQVRLFIAYARFKFRAYPTSSSLGVSLNFLGILFIQISSNIVYFIFVQIP